MYGDYEETNGKWSKKVSFWKILLVLMLIVIGCCLAAYARGSVGSSGNDERFSGTTKLRTGLVATNKKAIGPNPCASAKDGTFLCGDPKAYEEAAKVKIWYGTYTEKVITTAYNSVRDQTDSSPCISADGSDICFLKDRGEQTCAASLPFGTRIFIRSFGACVVRDRLSSRFPKRIDLYFGGADQIAAARAWGVREKEVTITTP